MGRPHLYGFAWQGKGDQQAPGVWDFQGNNLSETCGEDVERTLQGVSENPGPEELERLRASLVDIGVLPEEAELTTLEELQQKQAYLSGPVLREKYHFIVDELFPVEQARWEQQEGQEVIVSELARGRNLLSGEKPLSRVEAVIEFIEMGPYGDLTPNPVLDALHDLQRRIEAYEALPSPYEVDDLVNDPGKMGINEMMQHPDWIQDRPDVDAEELRRSFGPDPL